MSEFPKWKYHATHKPILIQTVEQEERLGEAWKNSPAEHGIVTAPSVKQREIDDLGFDPFAEAPKKVVEEEESVKIDVGPRKRR